MNQILSIYITHESEENAKAFCQQMIDENLIACANIFPAQSLYIWKGKLNDEQEYLSICKSITAFQLDIAEYCDEHHPYDVPCVIFKEEMTTPKYYDWVVESLEL